jgi:hypothetical protein
MARIRTIKPDFFMSPTVASLPHRTRLTFVGLWCYVDDKGRGYDDPRLVKAAVWPLDDEITHEHVEMDLCELAGAGLIERWTAVEMNGRTLLRVCSLLEHQRINRPSPSKLPPSPRESSLTPHAPLTESSPTEVEEEAEVEMERGSGGGSPQQVGAVRGPASIEEETNRRVAARRAKGHDIGPKLIELIRQDVERDLGAKPSLGRADCPLCHGSTWVEDDDRNAVPCRGCGGQPMSGAA